MTSRPVIILDRDRSVADWLLRQLGEIDIPAQAVPNVGDLIDLAEVQAPAVCLVALRAPVAQVLNLIAQLSQEPRFTDTAFILMGPTQYKRSAFESGADDYLITPPDVIELRKRVRLYLDRTAPAPLGEPVTSAVQEVRSHPAWELLARYSNAALALLHPNGSLLHTNPAWDALVGADADWPGSGETELIEALRRGTNWQGYKRGSHPNGTPWLRRVTLTVLRGTAGQLTGYVVTQVDLGERVAQVELQTQFFPEDIFEMRSALSNLKLRQHILSRAAPDQQTAHLSILEHETNRMGEIIERMVMLLRPDQGLIHMTLKTIRLEQLAAEIVMNHSSTAAHMGIALSLNPGDTPLTVLGDSAHLSRALSTLVRNALSHTPEGGHVTVSVFPSMTAEGRLAVVQVQDTGEGIAPKALPNIFERHFRSTRPITHGDEDSGLRLAIVKEIVHRHNGTITAESEPGQGSIFTIWLPTNDPG